MLFRSLRGTVENEGAFRCSEKTENELTVDGLLEVLERGGPEYQLTNDDARKLIDAGRDWLVADNLDRFTGLDVDIAYKLINSGYESQVLKFIHVFGESALYIVLVCMDKIESSVDLADAVLEHLSDYSMDAAMKSIILRACARHYSTKRKIIQLDLKGLIGAEEAFKLRECIAKFGPGVRGVSKYNPHEDRAGDMKHATSSRPGTEFHERAIQVDRRLDRKSTRLNSSHW